MEETLLQDPEATAFIGSSLYDDTRTVAYTCDRFLGGGGMSLTYLGKRQGPDGESAVVIKVMRPGFVRAASSAATLAMRKEAEALRRLNARTPPNPFVIRLVDSALARVHNVDVPWLALEYVHGGAEGTTLRERIDGAISAGDLPDTTRITRVIEQLRNALTEIHAAGIIHRDLKPENILCCGTGVDEILKIADFGIARSTGMDATFGVGIGTLGYAPPEQLGGDPSRIGPWTDVFALAGVMFYVITGLDPLDTESPRPRLRSVSESRWLHDELRGRTSTLKAIDELFQRAMSNKIEQRPQTAGLFAAALIGSLAVDSRPAALASLRPGRRTLLTMSDTRWQWSVAHRSQGDRVIRGVAWNSDGRCLAATNYGLSFWNGAAWADVDLQATPIGHGMRFVRRLSPGEWLVGGDRATLALFGTNGLEEVLHGPDASYSIQHASGDLKDLAVFVFVREGEPPTLYCLCNGRWLKPLPLEGVAAINSIARVGDAEWFIAGRNEDGSGYTSHYFPLYWEARAVDLAERAVLACASVRDGNAIVIGSVDGTVQALIGEEWHRSSLSRPAAIAACAIEPTNRAWLGTANRLWVGWPERGTPWVPVWTGDGQAPIVSIYADGGVVYAMTADGAIIEGRPEDITDLRDSRALSRN